MRLDRTKCITILCAIGMIALSGSRDAPSGQQITDTSTDSTGVVQSTASPAPTATPCPSFQSGRPQQTPAEPFNFGLISDQVAEDPGTLGYVSVSQFVVTGRVEEILPARWSTPDGTRPENPYDVVPQSATIVTPYIIALDSPPILNRTSTNLDNGRIVALMNGGNVRNDSVTIHLPWLNLSVGERVLITLDANPTTYNPPGPIATDAGPGWWLTMKWTLTDDGKAVSWLGTRDAADLVAEFSDAIEFLNPRTSPTGTSAS